MNEDTGKRVYVAGHTGLVGSAIVRALKRKGYRNIVTRSHAELDLMDQARVCEFFASEMIEEVYLAAAIVGGIHANDTYPADFIYNNLAIQNNVIHEAWRAGIRKLLFLGSSCIYPRMALQPMKEEALLTGPLEPTNEWYAVAKIAAIKLCEAYRKQHGADFISVMPTNLFGLGDNYHPDHSHVPAALIRRFHEGKLNGAPSVTVWGTGRPRREFLSSDDLADACIFVMKHYSGAGFLNVGTGKDITIAEFAEAVRDVVGYTGAIVYDTSRPDGPPQKLLDTSRLAALGWTPAIALREGLAAAYADFLAGVRTRETLDAAARR